MKRILLLLTIALSACSNEQPKENTTAAKTDTLKKDTVPVKHYANIVINKTYDELASYVAGMKNVSYTTLDSSLTKNTSWITFCNELDKSWLKHDSTHILPMKNWRATELIDTDAASTIIFYPFAGADFLNAYTFFPKAKEFILIGLEPAGSLPDFKTADGKTNIQNYFHSTKTSLSTILNYSFFRTIAMKSDFRQEELDGTIHLMLLFLKRTGNSIVDIKPVSIDSAGAIAIRSSYKEQKENPGIEIDFTDADSIVKKAYYFSLNLANDGMSKNSGLLAFTKQRTGFNTYLKSASYLMHKDYFSSIRNLILDESKNVLEDDSGIPYRFFTPEKWDITLYGSYISPIPMFSASTQPDLRKAFTDTSKVKPLPFGIGYKYRKGESVLTLARKK